MDMSPYFIRYLKWKMLLFSYSASPMEKLTSISQQQNGTMQISWADYRIHIANCRSMPQRVPWSFPHTTYDIPVTRVP